MKILLLLPVIVVQLLLHGGVIVSEDGGDDSSLSSSSSPSSFGLIHMLNRTSFPVGFMFGAAGAAYQFEGAWNIDGKGPSIWDDFTHKYPEKIADRSNGDVGGDSYHRYKEDIKLLKEMNADTYRFSISWSRVLPTGQISGGINEKGIEYYNKLIDIVIANGLVPTVTIIHFDTPLFLENAYGGFLSLKIIEDYYNYANLCFERFGDRVKHWITFNEPWTFSNNGYNIGIFAPGRCSAWMNNNCTGGDSSTEPYLVGHHQLLAHAKVVELYRNKYKAKQNGIIGITLLCHWMVPLSQSSVNKQAAARALDFMFGWYMDPIVYGKYPASMQTLVGKRLPKFTRNQSELLKGSFDFLGLNYYTANYASQLLTAPNNSRLGYLTDDLVNLTFTNLDGRLIGEQGASSWLHVYPRGIYELLMYIKNKYKDPIVYITENGIDEVNNASLPLKDALNDSFRISYYFHHLQFLHKAISNGARVRGYYGWSLLDNFEWKSGYSSRFGINYVDYNTLKRYRKVSSYWFEKFLKK